MAVIQDEGLRKLKGSLWELELAERHIDPLTKKAHCICKCKVDKDDPTVTCNKKLALTQGSTSSLRHHIRSNHPSDWARVIQMETDKANRTAANKNELIQVIAQAEGSIDEEEEDLARMATPGTSGQKRPAPGESDLFETPKSKKPSPAPAKSPQVLWQAGQFSTGSKSTISRARNN